MIWQIQLQNYDKIINVNSPKNVSKFSHKKLPAKSWDIKIKDSFSFLWLKNELKMGLIKRPKDIQSNPNEMTKSQEGNTPDCKNGKREN